MPTETNESPLPGLPARSRSRRWGLAYRELASHLLQVAMKRARTAIATDSDICSSFDCLAAEAEEALRTAVILGRIQGLTYARTLLAGSPDEVNLEDLEDDLSKKMRGLKNHASIPVWLDEVPRG